MWKVYAKRVMSVSFLSDLCNTLPWIMTRSPAKMAHINILHNHQETNYLPGSHSTSTYSWLSLSVWIVFVGSLICSNPVPPLGSLTKRLSIGVIRCDPGKKDNAPFFNVHFSNANQKPRAVGGSVYYLVVKSLATGYIISALTRNVLKHSVSKRSSYDLSKSYSRIIVFRY